jgi:hypothetical protein
MSEEVKRVKGVKKWAVGLVGRSWEQYAPDAVNSMQCGGRNLRCVLSDLWRKLAWRACGGGGGGYFGLGLGGRLASARAFGSDSGLWRSTRSILSCEISGSARLAGHSEPNAHPLLR